MRAALWTALLALLVGCGGGGGGEAPAAPAPAPAPRPAPAPNAEREVLPTATDAGIRSALEPHRVRVPSPGATAKGRLFVFLPGTGATPALYRGILRVGADRGYHAIGLNYPNAEAVGVLCLNSVDADCHGKVRNEVINGVDTSALVAVSPTESLLNRLTKLLQWLHAQSPGEGWGAFVLPSGALDWSRITVAGHSQGGGHAAWIAQQVAVAACGVLRIAGRLGHAQRSTGRLADARCLGHAQRPPVGFHSRGRPHGDPEHRHAGVVRAGTAGYANAHRRTAGTMGRQPAVADAPGPRGGAGRHFAGVPRRACGRCGHALAGGRHARLHRGVGRARVPRLKRPAVRPTHVRAAFVAISTCPYKKPS